MYTNLTLKPIDDNALYVGLDGTQWANTDKKTIKELHKVTETVRPDETTYIVTGFHIDKKYNQVWDTELRPVVKPEDTQGTPEYNLKHYKELRASEYPEVGTVVDALCKAQDGDSTEYDLIQEQRLAIKNKYPKSV